MNRVAILTFDNVALFELGCASELFALHRPEMKNWYQTDIVTFKTTPCLLSNGLQLSSQQIDSLADYDLLVIPSWAVTTDCAPTLAKEIQQFYQHGKRIISFCSGAFLLAQLGLLDDKKATTHWRYAKQFKHLFPKTKYVNDVLYVYDGQIGCSAGSSAAIDLGLEVIRQDFGFQAANSVARRLVLSAHRKGGQAQFAESPMFDKNGHFSIALDWALKNLSSSIHIDSFAQKANMSRRTFDRKFKANLKMSPKEWLTHQRLNLAKELLEKQTHGIEKIAELSGFENATTMRHHFRKEFGVSPSLHRNQFQVRHAMN